MLNYSSTTMAEPTFKWQSGTPVAEWHVSGRVARQWQVVVAVPLWQISATSAWNPMNIAAVVFTIQYCRS